MNHRASAARAAVLTRARPSGWVLALLLVLITVTTGSGCSDVARPAERTGALASPVSAPLVVRATKFYAPNRWQDGEGAASAAIDATLPATIPVLIGSAGPTHGATLSVGVMEPGGESTLTCVYAGSSSQPRAYAGPACSWVGAPSRAAPLAGARLLVRHARLHIDGDPSDPARLTEAEVRFGDVAPSTEAPDAVTAKPFEGIVASEPTAALGGASSVGPTGDFSYSIPLALPEGRASLKPSLSIHYGSRSGNGLLGVGATLDGFSEIRPCGKTIATENVTDGVSFSVTDALCLDGKKLVVVRSETHETEYRTENDSFAKIVARRENSDLLPEGFTVWSKDGRISQYGFKATVYATQVVGSGSPSEETRKVTFAWPLRKRSDRAGNEVRYRYTEISNSADGLEYLPLDVAYSIRDGEQAARPRTVTFSYEERPDSSARYVSGVRVLQTRRLQSVGVHVEDSAEGRQPLWTYLLNYEESAVTRRSLLRDVRRCDASGVCGTGKTFGWRVSDSQPPTPSPGLDTVDTGLSEIPQNLNPRFLLADVDGDGRDDVLYHRGFAPTVYVRLSQGRSLAGPIAFAGDDAGWDMASSRAVDIDNDGAAEILAWSYYRNRPSQNTGYQAFKWDKAQSTFIRFGPFIPTAPSGTPEAVDLGDADGDGLLDIFYARHTTAPHPYTWEVQLNQGNGHFAAPISLDTRACRVPQNSAQVLDVDGDGRAELLVPECSSSHRRLIAIGLQPGGPRVLSELGDLSYDTPWTFVDINGDGLRDALETYNGGIRWNTGRGFKPMEPLRDSSGFILLLGTDSHLRDRGLRVTDLDRDGRQDLVKFISPQRPGDAPSLRVYLSRGSHVESVEVANGPGRPDFSLGWTVAQIGDLNGDGVPDVVESLGTTGDSQMRLLMSRSVPPDLVESVRDDRGAEELVDYTNDKNALPNIRTCKYPQQCISRGLTVVSRHRTLAAPTSGAHVYRTRSFTYAESRFDLVGRGFLGFGEVCTTDESRGAKTCTWYDHLTRQGTVYPHAGVPWFEETTLPIDATRSRIVHRSHNYELRRLNLGRTFTVFHTDSHTTEQEGDRENILRDRYTHEEYDDFGNATRSRTWTTGGMNRIVDTDYEIRESDWLISLPSEVRQTSAPMGKPLPPPRLTKRYYDGRGLLDRVDRVDLEPLEPKLTLTTLYERDAFGLVRAIERRTPAGEARIERFEYASDGVHVQKVTDPMGHVTWMKVHPGLDVPTLTIDARGVATSSAYDGFGRLRRLAPTGGPVTSLSYDLHAVTAEDSTGQKHTTKLDALGRATREKVLGFDGVDVASGREFDDLGRLDAQTDASGRRTKLTYDGLDRVVRSDLPNGGKITKNYTFSRTVTTDAEGKESAIDRDIDERVLHSSDRLNQKWLTTTYGYDDFEQVDEVSHSFQAARRAFEHDRVGRVTKVTDPDFGSRSFEFSPFGSLLAETNALQRVEYTHDALGRVTRESVSGRVAVFTYDVHGAGLLAHTASSDGVVTRHFYDPVGRLQKTVWTVAGHDYEVDCRYDGFGRLSSVLYPAIGAGPRLEIARTYNAFGYVDTVREASAGNRELWRVLARTADGALKQSRAGNGLETTNDFYPTTGLFSRIIVPGHIELAYGYDLDGRATERADKIVGRKEAFGYDDTHRLVRWELTPTGAPTQIRDYVFSPSGNLTTTLLGGAVETSFTHGAHGAGPHAVTGMTTGATSTTFGYDPLGRRTDGPGQGITFTHFDLPARIVQGGLTTELRYDALHQRVLKTSSEGASLTLGGLYERRETFGANARTEHVFYVPGEQGPIAQITVNDATQARQIRYVHSDALGTPVALTDETGSVVERSYYEPFGARTDASGRPTASAPSSARRGFTGHEHDDELGLINMRGRVYDPMTRRFLSPDPLVALAGRSQVFDPYAYVQNNPTNLTDPSGFSPVHREIIPRPYGWQENVFDDSLQVIDITAHVGSSPPQAQAGKSDGAGFESPQAPTNGGDILGIESMVDPSVARSELGNGTPPPDYGPFDWGAFGGGVWNSTVTDQIRVGMELAPVFLPDLLRDPARHLYAVELEIIRVREPGPEARPASKISHEMGRFAGPAIVIAATMGLGAGVAVEEAAGGGAAGIRVTAKGLARVEGHLAQLGALEEPANAAMLGRLRAGETAAQDINFYMHELKESAVMARTGGYTGYDAARAAHMETLQWQGIPYAAGYESQLYHPSVIRAFSEMFNPAAWPK